MNYSKDIVFLDFEISSLCNAGCSACMRRRQGHFSEFVQTYWSIEEVKRVIDLEIIKNINNLTLCGNFGDAMANPDVVEIVKYFRAHNEHLTVVINTNGGVGEPEQYEELAKMHVKIVFGIDGIGNKNELYRVNVKWDKLTHNIKSFAKFSRKHNFEVQFLMWAETIDQIDGIIDYIKGIGFGTLYLRKPYTLGEKTPVYDMDGKLTHYLTEVKDKNLIKYFETWWEYEKLDLLKIELSKLNFITNPLELGDVNYTSTKFKWPRKKYAYTKVEFTESQEKILKEKTHQTCYSKNFNNPNDITGNKYNLYITYDKMLMPCCMIPPNISNSINYHKGDESPYSVEVLNKMLSIGFDRFSLKKKTLKEVFNSGVIHEFVYSDLENNRPLKMCTKICGKCK